LDLEIEERDSVAMIVQPYQLYVERMDTAKNMARFYAMSIEATLFGDVCLTRRWGRIGACGQAMQHYFNKEEDAVQLFLKLLRSKRVRGYGSRTGDQQHSRRARQTS
jgi:predicted DNA-binding WGR domain protein